MVQAVPDFVVPTMADMIVDVPVAVGDPVLPSPVLITTVAVPVPAVAPVDYAVRAAPTSSVAPMAAAVFDVAVAPAAPVKPNPTPATMVATPMMLPVAPEVIVVGPLSSDAMV